MKKTRRLRAAALCGMLMVAPVASAEADEHVLIHVKTALSVDDAQICAVPNVAWATVMEGRQVTLLFDASAVTSITKGFGWRGWFWDQDDCDGPSCVARAGAKIAGRTVSGFAGYGPPETMVST